MLGRKVAINEEQVLAFLENLFEEDLHAKRVLSLAHATLGVVHAASLSVHAIGQALDWTDFEADDHTTLVASLVTSHGRATPLLWLTLQKSALSGNRAQAEDELLLRLKECVPEGVKVTVLADRGFADQRLYALLAQAGFEYVVRFRK
ncbi:IS4 family transposase, partial [Corallococcus exiguus]|nr:IS4 family transposase [Corallococcus exiguus]